MDVDNDNPSVLENGYPFRVFISYSHKDRNLVERMVQILESIGFEPLWDKNISPGKPFTDEIKDLIARAHLFIPLITKNSQERPWVHQETGYAQAMNIPILPITLEGKDLPSDMIAQLQAIIVKPELENLIERLQQVDIEHLVLPAPRRPHSVVEVADWPEQRAELMLRYIQWVRDLNVRSPVRQRASSTTFSIPDKDIKDRVWKARDGFYDGRPLRSDYFHQLQREELRALSLQASMWGCSLIMSHPDIMPAEKRPVSRRVRLESLRDFFRTMTDDNLKLVFLPRSETSNTITVGDYFVAESVASRLGGWLQTVFNSHPPTVLQRIRRFDQEFAALYPNYGVTLQDAIREIEQVLENLPSVPEE